MLGLLLGAALAERSTSELVPVERLGEGITVFMVAAEKHGRRWAAWDLLVERRAHRVASR